MSETAIDYTTHILIGVKKSGEMTVLAQWPRVPRQADVDGKIQSAKEPYIKFVLCRSITAIRAGCAQLRFRDRRITCQAGPSTGSATAPARQPCE
jgi:hypothetical protein